MLLNVGVQDKKGEGGEGEGCSKCSVFWASYLFFNKENWICAMTRHHAEPNINILLTKNLPFYSDVRQ